MYTPFLSLGQWINLLSIALALIGVILYLYARGSQRSQMLSRLHTEISRKGSQLGDSSKHDEKRDFRSRATTMLQRLGAAVPILSPAQQKEVSQKLIHSGIRNSKAPLIVSALSMLCAVGAIAASIIFIWPFIDNQPMILKLLTCVMALYVGMLLPRLIIDRLVKARQKELQESLPDALDMLVICTNAGLSMGVALQRVAAELTSTSPALADELNLTSSEMQVSSDVAVVLNNLAYRTDLPAIRSLVSTLINAMQFGTSITQALRVLARSERTARMMRLEEQAAKLAVKITMPMMMFIMPTVIIIAVGPAVLGMSKILKSVF
jgi:tight adherence protein C